MTAEEKLQEYDLSFMSDVDLVLMQAEVNKFPEDHDFRQAVLRELGKRQNT